MAKLSPMVVTIHPTRAWMSGLSWWRRCLIRVALPRDVATVDVHIDAERQP